MGTRWTAKTNFVARFPDGRRVPLTVAIGVPKPAEGDEWSCAVALEGLFDDLEPMVAGDALQALGLAWGLVAQLLTHFEATGGVLEFTNGEIVPLAAYFPSVVASNPPDAAT